MPYMYILECADGSYYTGSARNLEKRLWEHQNGLGARYTQKRLPVKLVYCEPHDRVEDAYRREKQIQGWSRRKKQALIEGNTENLIEFSKNYTQYGRPDERLALSPLSPSTGSGDNTSPSEFVEASSELVEDGVLASTSSANATSSANESPHEPCPEQSRRAVEGGAAEDGPTESGAVGKGGL